MGKWWLAAAALVVSSPCLADIDKGSCSFDTKMIFGQEKTKFSQCMIKVSVSEGHDGKHISLIAMYMLSNKRHDFIWKFPGISRHAKNDKRS